MTGHNPQLDFYQEINTDQFHFDQLFFSWKEIGLIIHTKLSKKPELSVQG